MAPRPKSRIRLLVLLAATAAACTSTKDVIPPSGSLRLRITYDGLVSQSDTSRSGPQLVLWRIESATAEVGGVGSFRFIENAPCFFAQSVRSGVSNVAEQCRGSGLSLRAGKSQSFRLHLTLSSMELRRAWRPDFAATRDYDGDGAPWGVDNCELVPNPDQKDVNRDGWGDACSQVNSSTGLRTVPDSDNDGVADQFDNCIWVENDTQDDSDRDGLGDACQRVAPVRLPGGVLELNAEGEFSIHNAALTYLDVTFDEENTPCDPGFNSCTVLPDKLTVTTR